MLTDQAIEAAKHKATVLLAHAGCHINCVPMGLAVTHPLFTLPGGDDADCYIAVVEKEGELWPLYRIEENGDILDCTKDSADRKRVIDFADRFGVVYDEDADELHMRDVKAADLPGAVLSFLVMVQALARWEEDMYVARRTKA